MCQAVRRMTGEAYWCLNDLVKEGLITPDLIPEDPELHAIGVSAAEVCFCNVDVEEVLERAGVEFWVEELGDVVLGSKP